MTNTTPTYIAAKATGSPLNWRGTYTLSTSSRLSNQTLNSINERTTAESAAIVALTESGDYSFFNGIEDNLGKLANIFTNPEATDAIATLDEQIFSLQSSLNLFEQGLIASKSLLDIKFYSDCTIRFKELQEILINYKKKSSINLSDVTNIFTSQIKNIRNIDGTSGKTLANDLLNEYLSESVPNNSDTINLIKSVLEDFLPLGSLGEVLLERAQSIIGSSIALLEQAYNNFSTNTDEPLKRIDVLLSPVYNTLNGFVGKVKNIVSNELSDITRDIIGENSTVDNAIRNGVSRVIDNGLKNVGLSINDSTGRQLQPLAGKYSVDSGVRISSGTFTDSYKNELNFNNYYKDTSSTSFNGTNSILPSAYIKSNISHPRESMPQNSRIISSSANIVIAEVDNLKLNMIDAYRKMPGSAIKNPELANGVSLTSIVFEDEALKNINNTNNGTTVGSITGIIKTADQVFVPRLR